MSQRIVQGMQRLRTRRALWAIGLAGLVARVAFVLATQQIGGAGALDAATYHGIAVHLIEGRGFSEDGINPSCFVAPLYPFFLAAVYFLAGVRPLLIELVQAVLGSVTAWLLYLLVRSYFNRGPAVIAFVLALFMPELVVLSTFLYTETVFIFLFVATLWLAARAVAAPTWKRLAVAGLVAGLTTLTRGVTLFLPVLLGIALLLQHRPRVVLRQITLYGLFFALPIIPWAIRNYVVFEAFVPIAVGTGDVLWTGNYLPLDGKYSYDRTMALMDSMTAGMNQVQRERRLRQEAIDNIMEQPRATLGLMGRKLMRFWFWIYESAPTGGQRRGGTAVQLVLALSYYPLLFFSIIGLWLSRRKWRALLLIYLVIGYYTALHVLMLVVPRYRIPLLPLLFLFAGVALWELWRRWQSRSAA